MTLTTTFIRVYKSYNNFKKSKAKNKLKTYKKYVSAMTIRNDCPNHYYT